MSVAGQVSEQTLETLQGEALGLSFRERLRLTARQNRFATVGVVMLVAVLCWRSPSRSSTPSTR